MALDETTEALAGVFDHDCGHNGCGLVPGHSGSHDDGSWTRAVDMMPKAERRKPMADALEAIASSLEDISDTITSIGSEEFVSAITLRVHAQNLRNMGRDDRRHGGD